jgi:hypothetical protein
MMWKEAFVALFKALSWHLPAGLRKTTKDLSEDSLSPGRDLNPRSPEYEAGALITRLRRSVVRLYSVDWKDNI